MIAAVREKENVEAFNRCIKYLKKSPLHLHFDPLNKEILQIRIYADAAFGIDIDCNSQFEYIVLLCDEKITVHVLEFLSKNSRGIVR